MGISYLDIALRVESVGFEVSFGAEGLLYVVGIKSRHQIVSKYSRIMGMWGGSLKLQFGFQRVLDAECNCPLISRTKSPPASSQLVRRH